MQTDCFSIDQRDRPDGWWWVRQPEHDDWIPCRVYTDADEDQWIELFGGRILALDTFEGEWCRIEDTPETDPVFTVGEITIARRMVEDLIVSMVHGVGGYVMPGRDIENERFKSWLVVSNKRGRFVRRLVPDHLIVRQIRAFRGER